jgi:hypothetical protein
MRYDFHEKQRWFRQPVWDAVDAFMGKPRPLRTVLYLDTKQALETKHLLDLGYRPDNLHAVNMNPAEVAVLTKRVSSERGCSVRTHGKRFDDVAWGFGPVDILSFDGVSNLCGGAFKNELANAVMATTPRVITITVLVGRETAEWFEAIQEAAKNAGPVVKDSCNRDAGAHHWARIKGAVLAATTHMLSEDRTACVAHVERVRWGTYRSTSNQTMAWVVAKVVPHKRGCRPGRGDDRFVPACAWPRNTEKFHNFCPDWTLSQAALCGWTPTEFAKARSVFA